jgi:hypothetical protein
MLLKCESFPLGFFNVMSFLVMFCPSSFSRLFQLELRLEKLPFLKQKTPTNTKVSLTPHGVSVRQKPVLLRQCDRSEATG